jgi:pimeloyl-ACP methyl ester carboxylesterase
MDVELVMRDGVARTVTDVGHGSPVVLLPAGGERRAVWDPVIAALAPAGHRCLALDQRAPDIAFDTVVADVLALCDHLGAPAVLVGCSLGGFAALGAAAAEPTAVAGVVLVDVLPDPDPDGVRAYLGPLGLLGPLVDEILGRAGELRAALTGLQVPVRLVRGAASPVVDDAARGRFRDLAPGGDLATVPGAGHLVAQDRPLLLAGVLLDFLAALAGGDVDRTTSNQSVAVRVRARDLLVARGAAGIAHLGGDLLTHLAGTEARLWSWGVPADVALAGLTHAAYGTDGFVPHLLELDERPVLADAIGAGAEAIVYRYAACDRAAMRPHRGQRPLRFTDRFTGTTDELTGSEAFAFALVSAANELDLIDRGVVDAAGAARIRSFVRQLATHAPDVLTPEVSAGATVRPAPTRV